MQPSVSVVIPVYNAAEMLGRCLRSIEGADECIVVDDGSTDGSGEAALALGVQVVSPGDRRGPAAARNAGARAATGDVILFLDADVCAHSDTVRRVKELFAADSLLDAVMGCYDDSPADRSFWSQYRNLLHSYYHRAGRERATTFWTGCGAIRRQVFLDFHGFDEVRYRRPSIEDIELGDRMYREHRQLRLDHSLLVTHWKRWTFWSILRTDVVDRGIPWTQLILSSSRMPDDLNVKLSQRWSVLLIAAAVLLALAGLWIGAAAALTGVTLLNLDTYRFFARRRGIWFAVRCIPMHWLYHLYNGLSFAAGSALALWQRKS